MFLVTFLCVTLLLVDGAVTYNCDVRNMTDGCEFTVFCQHFVGKIGLPPCNRESNVTFVVAESTSLFLSYGLFSSTNFDSRVRIFKANHNSWSYIDSHTFKYYPRTLKIDLSANKVIDIKDYAFKELEVLQTLNLSSNLIKDLDIKSLFISDRPELVSLDLSNNYLSELKSFYFNYLPKLEFLNLENNLIGTIVDDSFTDLRSLEVLRLKNNFLWHLNMTLINLKKLKHLDVSQNFLLRLSGYEINRVVSLQIVNMSRNHIQFIEENCFNQAFNLETIDFSYNNIESDITAIMFINSSKLKYLNLYNNSITKIEYNTFKHNSLEYLNIEKNDLTLNITENFFQGLQNITKLGFQQQHIQAIRNQSFSRMNMLLYFNASQNQINIIEQGSFTGADSLQILDLSYNHISELTFLKECLANVTELYLSNNNLTNLPRDSFNDQTSLIRLDISMNKIVSLEPNSLPLDNLQYLNILGNNFSGVISKDIFSQAHTLRFLDASDFKFNKIDAYAFEDMPTVAKMNLSNNEIDFINPKNFINLDNLFSLDLACNRLTYIILNDSSLTNLKALYLNNNIITDMSMSFVNASSIIYLDLSSNNISDVSNGFLKQLPNLQVLNLSHNKIIIFNNQETNSLSNLKEIDLSSNMLSKINLSYYHDLLSAHLSNNQLTYISESLFVNLDHLKYLDITSNNISDLIPGTFQSVKALQVLNLSRNNLTDLRFGSLRGLQSMQLLDISRNSISDLNVHVFHECGELIKLIVDYNRLQRLDVENLMANAPKLTTLSLGGNPVSCEEIVRHVKLGNKTSIRQVEVTSMDKIYHEDNVYGIKCGDVVTTKPKVETAAAAITMLSKLDYTLIFISLFVFLAGVAGLLFIRHKHRKSSGHLQFSAIELDNSSVQQGNLI